MKNIVVGAGATGVATARLLAEAGHEVTLVSRRANVATPAGVKYVSGDASDANFMSMLAAGAQTLFNCAMPPYDSWPKLFPPLGSSLLAAAERSGANYVMLGNCYGYEPSAEPITESSPIAPTSIKGRVRAKMWADAMTAHHSGRVRVAEVRASDFLGANAGSLYTLTILPRLTSREPIAYPANLDVEHSWTYTEDAARTLIAAALNDAAWGRAWHVPPVSNESAREVTFRLSQLAGIDPLHLIRMNSAEVEKIGRDDSIMAEISEMLYMFEQPFVMDAALTQQTLGVSASSLDRALSEMLTHASSAT
ncbi:FAD-dependent oxidoreductase [Lysobacter sp. TAB13]|uniref:FAD-dependent oxidoreductase n=1 Tax=Lysobacter sp. TAB13 TaxID=3233065 RepID=UPI003F9AEF1B